jgi:Holliday junction resolvase RusA-like endonuclease
LISNDLGDWFKVEHVSGPVKRVMEELEKVRLVLPLPPSTNAFWRSVVIKGAVRVLVSREGRAWKKLADVAVAAQCRRVLEGNVSVSIVAYLPDNRRDLDNIIKPALDCIQGAGYKNDRQIVKLIAEKRYDKFNPRLEVELEAA